MSKNISPSSSGAQAAGKVPAESVSTVLPSGSLARRHMLLKSLGKGSAVIAAVAVPMHSLASPSILTGKGAVCSISGQQSGVHSHTSPLVCSGKSPGYWHTFANWPANAKALSATPFSTLFHDAGANNGSYTIKQFLCSIGNGGVVLPVGVKLNNTDEWHWCAAWVNAMASGITGTGVSNFPYSPAKVIEIYGNPNMFGITRANALSFFKLLEN